jgi:hypothetical protein
LNALKHANRIYGADLFDLDAWSADGAIESAETRHELFYRALYDTNVGKRRFRKDQRIDIGHSIKYSLGETQRLFRRAKAQQADRWLNSIGDYGKLCASRPCEVVSCGLTLSLTVHAQDCTNWNHTVRRITRNREWWKQLYGLMDDSKWYRRELAVAVRSERACQRS